MDSIEKINVDHSKVAFLGLADKCRYRVDTQTTLQKTDILGLKNLVFTYIFPYDLYGATLIFALYVKGSPDERIVRFLDRNGEEQFKIQFQPKISPEQVEKNTDLTSDGVRKTTNPVALPQNTPVWCFFSNILDTHPLISEPTQLIANEVVNGIDVPIGWMEIRHIRAPEFTSEFISAVKANPFGRKSVTITIGCSICERKLKAYASVDRLESEKQGVWFQDLPELFECECKTVRVPLVYLRQNLHALLNLPSVKPDQVEYDPLYEASTIEEIAKKFKALIDQQVDEQIMQLFIEANPLVLHMLSPQKIFKKAPILSKYKTDFCIVNNKQELLLVEIERPGAKIMKKKGHTHSDLQHAFDQVTDWMHTVDDSRQAVLDCIGLENKEVSSVRSVVICGSDSECDAEALRKLKAIDRGKISFYTYTDVLRSLTGFATRLREL